MHPTLVTLELGGVARPLSSYGALLAVAVVVGGLSVARAATRNGLELGAVVAIVASTVGAGFVGARALFVVVEAFRGGDWRSAIALGGLVALGAPLGGLPALWLLCRRFAIPMGRLADLAVPALAQAHAMGRLGCFLAGCCFGAPAGDDVGAALAVRYDDALAAATALGPVDRHPVQLYESAGLLALALAFHLAPVRALDGRRALAYAVGYAVLRLGTESVRGDVVRGIAFEVASTSQIASGALGLAALVGLVVVSRRARVAREASR
ncbi:MAG: prolipoprotein diacylglyceryl transferase [Deltaproteobacteria bacterium]|nr:prolipoprotein diacylglyceryl transferase [Deltaproteobacteria bacterium]